MARPKLRRPDQSWPAWLALGLFEAAASLRLAVVLLGLLAAVLAWATFVEREYGSAAVRFGLYGSWWFAALLALLGVNVASAALIRFPWRRYQTGFLITHAGILVLLFGCLWSSRGGIDAQMPIYEGETGHLAFEDGLHFQLIVQRPGRKAESIEIPFAAGPFSWRDDSADLLRWPWSADPGSVFWFPWRLVRRDRGVLYDRDGIRLEALDYLSDSRLVEGSPLRLRAKGRSEGVWESVELSVARTQDPHAANRQMALGSRQALAGGERIAFWVAESQAETEAFLQTVPTPPLGPQGQVVLSVGGKAHVLDVGKLAAAGPVPLDDDGLEARLVRWDPRFLLVEFQITRRGKDPEKMLLLADFPEFNRQDHRHGVFGTYWFDAARADALRRAEPTDAEAVGHLHQPRIDVLQGADGKLYYRAWKSPQLCETGTLPTDGSPVTVFARGPAPVSFYRESFQAHDGPGWKAVPVRFDRSKDDGLKQRRARVRLTVDGRAEEFWLEALPPDPQAVPDDLQQRFVCGERQRVAITLPRNQVDVGFRLRLEKFERKLDPGTSQASYYASLVDLLPRRGSDEPIEKKILITLNHPVNLSDPANGRSYRIYQEAFRGPFRPGDPLFQQIVEQQQQRQIAAGQSGKPREELFMSWLTVNYDPGRGLKYAGSLLIVAGVLTMFYMRAYFFRLRSRNEPER